MKLLELLDVLNASEIAILDFCDDSIIYHNIIENFNVDKISSYTKCIVKHIYIKDDVAVIRIYVPEGE